MTVFTLSGLFSLGLFGCNSGKDGKKSPSWDAILKEIEITIALQVSDSLKAERINEILKKYSVTIEQYRNFYQKSIEEANLEQLPLLKAIEKAISQEMTDALRNEQGKMRSQQLSMQRNQDSEFQQPPPE